MLNCCRPGFIVKRWKADEEDFIDVNICEEEQERIRSNYAEISLYLGPYPSECHRDWISLSNFITQRTLHRVMPQCGRIYSCAQFLSESSSSQQRLAAKALEKAAIQSSNPEDLLPKLQVIPETEIQFLPIPAKPLCPANSLPTDITNHGIDQTYTLEKVFADISLLCEPIENDTRVEKSQLCVSEMELLAELQFCFLVFLLNHLLDGWNQWRKLVQLLARCETAIQCHPSFYLNLITVLYHQLNSAAQSKVGDESKEPSSTLELVDLFFSEADSSSSSHQGNTSSEPRFLPVILGSLIRNLFNALNSNSSNLDKIDSQLKNNLLERTEGFYHSLESRFRWGLKLPKLETSSQTDEVLVSDVDWDGDEAPVIVQL